MPPVENWEDFYTKWVTMTIFNKTEQLQDMFITKNVDKEKIFLFHAEAVFYEAFKGHNIKQSKQKQIIDTFITLIEEKFNNENS